MRAGPIAELFDDPGPFASAYVEVSRDAQNADQRVGLAARDAADRLADQGAPFELADRVRDALTELTQQSAPVSRCVVATERGVLLNRLTPVHRPQPLVVYDTLPDVADWMADQADASTFVLAIADHEGGEVATYGRATVDQQDHAEVGEDSPWVNKVGGGGWAHYSLQRSTETVRARNADEVTTELARQLTDDVDVIVVGGEPDARRRVADAHRGGAVEVVELEHARRTADGGGDETWQEIEQIIANRATARRLAAVHNLRDRMGQGQRVAVGVADVTEALIQGQVEQLLLDHEAAAGYTVTPADHPGLALGSVPLDKTLRGDRALIALAALTDSDVVITRASTMAGAVAAATLRW